MPNISVALAAYNGEKYIREQINSILIQLRENDELIVSLNPSSDNTEKIIRSIALEDNRVKIYISYNLGVIANFENAIRKCNNEIIFLSDQDDIWVEGKIKRILNSFEDENIGLVFHDIQVVDENLKPIDIRLPRSYRGEITPFKIFICNHIQGSCMAFRKIFVDKIIPFPMDIPMHDIWISMIIAHYSIVKNIDDKLIKYRRHEGTVTDLKRRSIGVIIKSRIVLLLRYFCRLVS